jgi:hypothetical protein
LEGPGDIVETLFINARAREEKVNIVRSRPGGVFLICALEPDVRIAYGIDVLRPVLGVCQILFEDRGDVGDIEDPPGCEDRVRPCRPVDTGGLLGLRRIGRLLAQSLCMVRARFRPQPAEDGTPLGIELLDGEYRDVAVLWIDPRGRPACEEHKTRQKGERPRERFLQHTCAAKREHFILLNASF